ncbi:UNKNOWN [Stylonychia lemnae]|uniref:Uncharacterized protein n=1 Tax=Stylonychia lemnae TaxID=5949 RepID=A0A078AYN4_STYLE|nr:UNKNOWN [Stylonychia lemnae]|eukprot:CDW87279.1 UNKNOWN [Stylonychia lemnae]
MVPLADLMQKMIEIQDTLPFIRRLETIFDKQDEKMSNINYKISKFMDSNEINTKLDIFEQDLFLKLQHKLEKMENKLCVIVDMKANKQEVNDYIKCKANFTDLQRAQERILQIDMQLNGMLQSQDSGSSHMRETLNRVVADLERTQSDIARFAKSDELLGMEQKIKSLEDFMLENLASSMKNPIENSIDDEKKQFKVKKHINQHGYGEDYLNLVKRRYEGKAPNQIPLKEKASYLQVQNNEIGDKILTHEQISQNLLNQIDFLRKELQSQGKQVQESLNHVKNVNDFIETARQDQQRMEEHYSQAQKEQKSLFEKNKKLEESLVNLRQEQKRLSERGQRDHDDFSQKLMKLEVNAETQQREIELLKQMRRQILDKLESETFKMNDMRTKIEHKSQEYDKKISKIAQELKKLRENVEFELDKLREPLAIEINKMRQENEQLHQAFENTKNDYRDLSGGFLKILSNQQSYGNMSKITDSPQDDIQSMIPKLKDQFLNKQVMQKTFYSETQRVNSPFSTVQPFNTDDKVSTLNIVPLPDIPKIFLKAQINQHQQSQGLNSNRSCSTARTSNQKNSFTYHRKAAVIDHYKQLQLNGKGDNEITTPRIFENSQDEKESMNVTGSGWLAPSSVTRSHSNKHLMSPNSLKATANKTGTFLEGQKLKKFKHLMESSQKIDEEDVAREGDTKQYHPLTSRNHSNQQLLKAAIGQSNNSKKVNKSQDRKSLSIGQDRPKTDLGRI